MVKTERPAHVVTALLYTAANDRSPLPRPPARMPENHDDLRQLTDEEREWLSANPPHRARLDCGHAIECVLPPIVGWAEWCSIDDEFRQVRDVLPQVWTWAASVSA